MNTIELTTNIFILVSPNKNHPSKKLWFYLKGQHQEYGGISSLFHVDNFAYMNGSIKANVLNKQFALVFAREDTATVPNLSGITFRI